MEQNIGRNLEKGRIIENPDELRSVLDDIWRREVSKEKTKEQLRFQDAIDQEELLRAGYVMSAYLRRDRKIGDHPKQDFESLIVASTSGIKRRLIEEATSDQDITVEGGLPNQDAAQEEEDTHKILHRLIQGQKDYDRGKPVEPMVRYFTPCLYALDVAESKMRHAEERECDKNMPILACDVVVLEGERILEKPKNKAEAITMLREIAGKEIEVSFGATLLSPSRVGRILLKEAGRMKIHLRDFNDKDIGDYFATVGENYLSIAGGIDYASPAAKPLIDEFTPVVVEQIEDVQYGSSRGSKSVSFSPKLLEKMKDYAAGVPRELVRAMIHEARVLGD